MINTTSARFLQAAVFGLLMALAADAAELVTREVSLGKVLPTAITDTLIISPDQKHVAYAALRGGKWLAVHDGTEGKVYGKVIGLTFSPDSKHLAYVARRGDNLFIVQDSIESKEYD